MTGRVVLPIHTERLTIRPMRLHDAKALHELYSDPEAMQYLASDLPTSVAASRRWVQDKIELHRRTGLSLWTVERSATGEVIGDAGLQLLDDEETVELAVRIVRRLWRQGYGSEAARALIAAGLRDLDVDRIVGMTAPFNEAALAAMERIGMRLVGRESHYGGVWVVYEMRRDGFQPRKRPQTARAATRASRARWRSGRSDSDTSPR